MSFASRVRRLLIGDDAVRRSDEADTALRAIEKETQRQARAMERSVQETRQTAQVAQSSVRVAMVSMNRIMGAQHDAHRQ